MKYNVGDLIIFRDDLKVDEIYDYYYYYDAYMNRIIVENEYLARITHLFAPEGYFVDIFDDDIVVTDAMIKGLQPTADMSAILDILEV